VRLAEQVEVIVMVEKSEREDIIGRPSCKRENIIKMDLREIMSLISYIFSSSDIPKTNVHTRK
jgi:hypothetical protein